MKFREQFYNIYGHVTKANNVRDNCGKKKLEYESVLTICSKYAKQKSRSGEKEFIYYTKKYSSKSSVNRPLQISCIHFNNGISFKALQFGTGSDFG